MAEESTVNILPELVETHSKPETNIVIDYVHRIHQLSRGEDNKILKLTDQCLWNVSSLWSDEPTDTIQLLEEMFNKLVDNGKLNSQLKNNVFGNKYQFFYIFTCVNFICMFL